MSDNNVVEDAKALAEIKRLDAKRLKTAAQAKRKSNKKMKALEARKLNVRNEFEREKKFGEITYQRWEKDWEKMLEAFSQVELRNEVQAVFGKFRSMLDCKENLIERLRNDLKTAQEYMQFGAEGHMEVIKYLNKTFEILMKSIKDLYEEETFKAIELYRNDYNMHRSVNLCRQNFFESILIGSNELSSQILNQTDISFCEISEECTNKSVEKRELLRDTSIKRMQKLFDQMRHTASLFRSTSMSPNRVRHYREFVRIHEKDEHQIRKNVAIFAKMHSTEMELMRQRNQLELDSMVALENLNQEKQYFMTCFVLIRGIVEGEIDKDEKMSRRFSYGAYQIHEKLRSYQLHGEHLMNMLTVCAKLETQDEKILPFSMYKSEDLATLECSSHENLSKLDFFWVRVNNVVKQNEELEEEKRYLTDENAKLQVLIRRYCRQDNYSKSIETLGLCARKTEIIMRQEASHMVKTKHLNRLAKDS